MNDEHFNTFMRANATYTALASNSDDYVIPIQGGLMLFVEVSMGEGDEKRFGRSVISIGDFYRRTVLHSFSFRLTSFTATYLFEKLSLVRLLLECEDAHTVLNTSDEIGVAEIYHEKTLIRTITSADIRAEFARNGFTMGRYRFEPYAEYRNLKEKTIVALYIAGVLMQIDPITGANA